MRLRGMGMSAIPIVLATVAMAACGSATTSPSSSSAGSQTTPTPDPQAGWTTIPHFESANAGHFFATLRVPPGWTYVPANRTGTGCGTAVCSTSDSDMVNGPGQASLAMAGPTADPGDCTTYARGTAAGETLVGQEPLTVSGVTTIEYEYSRGGAAGAADAYIVPLSDSMVGCVAIQVRAGTPATAHGVVDSILESISFQASS